MRYYIADLHFFHADMNTKMDRRGFASAEEMNEYMKNKWNGKVRRNDEVVIIGDLSWGNAEQTNGLLEQFQEITRNTVTTNAQGEEQHIPCNMINCFCMYSDYEPLTLDEWIELDKKRRKVSRQAHE